MADGADCIDGVGQRCGDREHAFGPAASTTTMWRLVDARIDAAHLPGIRATRAFARASAWAGGAAPAPGEWLHLDVDATITIDHSDNKESAAATCTFGHHPLLVFGDRPEIAGGEALAGLLRPGNAGSNTAADHITVLGWALESLPAAYRPHMRCMSWPGEFAVTAFITDTPPGVVAGQLGGLELRHRQHAQVEDRIREAKATGLGNLPCHRADANAAWLEIIMAAPRPRKARHRATPADLSYPPATIRPHKPASTGFTLPRPGRTQNRG